MKPALVLMLLLLCSLAEAGAQPAPGKNRKGAEPKQHPWQTDTVRFGEAFPPGIKAGSFVLSKLQADDRRITYLNGKTHQLYLYDRSDTVKAWHLLTLPDTLRYYAYRLQYRGLNADSIYRRFNLVGATDSEDLTARVMSFAYRGDTLLLQTEYWVPRGTHFIPFTTVVKCHNGQTLGVNPVDWGLDDIYSRFVDTIAKEYRFRPNSTKMDYEPQLRKAKEADYQGRVNAIIAQVKKDYPEGFSRRGVSLYPAPGGRILFEVVTVDSPDYKFLASYGLQAGVLRAGRPLPLFMSAAWRQHPLGNHFPQILGEYPWLVCQAFPTLYNIEQETMVELPVHAGRRALAPASPAAMKYQRGPFVHDFRVSGNRLRMLYSNTDEKVYRDFVYDIGAKRVLRDEPVKTGKSRISPEDMQLRIDGNDRLVGASDACQCLVYFRQ